VYAFFVYTWDDVCVETRALKGREASSHIFQRANGRRIFVQGFRFAQPLANLRPPLRGDSCCRSSGFIAFRRKRVETCSKPAYTDLQKEEADHG